MKKESMTVFDIIDEVNQDLGEDLVVAYKSENGNWPVSAKVREIKLAGGFATKQLCYEYEIIKSKQKVEMLKKQVLSVWAWPEVDRTALMALHELTRRHAIYGLENLGEGASIREAAGIGHLSDIHALVGQQVGCLF